jgi:photosystem II stability/assembly factor-like uncharacterized protein
VPQEEYGYFEWELQFLSDSDAIMIGNNNGSITIRNSSDSGNSWNTTPKADYYMGSMKTLDMDFVDPFFGWVLYSNYSNQIGLLMTNNSGQSWDQSEPPAGSKSFFFADRSRGWIIGDAGLVARTDDSGRSWNVESIPFPGAWDDISFSDRAHGWVVSSATGDNTCQQYNSQNPGHLTVFRTGTGGDTWDGPICVEVPERGNGFEYRANMHFVNATTGWIVSSGGVIRKTSDGGTTWGSQDSGVAVDLHNVFFLNEQTGWIAGQSGTLLSTTDGGLHWRHQRSSDRDLSQVRFVDQDHGWIASTSGLFQTSDRGSTWDPIDVSYAWFVDPVDVNHIWILAGSSKVMSFSPVCLP